MINCLFRLRANLFSFLLFVHYPEYHSDLPPSKLSGVPDNARGVMGCS